ncbi:MAG: RNA polymerase sigma factor [Ilumatobacteraceae bacterium]|nr:RNA polymerase sigma factor [Ilumatobacteraceae bacterium]
MCDQIDSAVPRRGIDATRVVGGWFDLHVETIHSYVARRVGDEAARDVTAETFKVALEQFNRFDPKLGGERAWLYGIASNLLRRHWRTEQRRLRAQLRHAGSDRVPGDPLIAVDARVDAERRWGQVIAAVEDLEPEDRDLLVLIAWERCTSGEAAQALGIPAGTVRSRLSRIRTQLRNERGAPQ